MNGYLKIRVMAEGKYFDCWQKVEDGSVISHVDDTGAPVTLPAVHEAVTLTGQLHFAPNVLNAPDVG